jgi:acylphosphatase
MREALMDKVKVRVRIEGLVQGVNYRYATRQKAQELGVNGWVRNLADGSVESLMEGERDKVEALIRWCHQGPPGAGKRRPRGGVSRGSAGIFNLLDHASVFSLCPPVISFSFRNFSATSLRVFS